jgi:hypothetical protein
MNMHMYVCIHTYIHTLAYIYVRLGLRYAYTSGLRYAYTSSLRYYAGTCCLRYADTSSLRYYLAARAA